MGKENEGWIKQDGLDSLFEQMATITKASAYDILAKQVKELKMVIRDLITFGELDEIEFTNIAETEHFQQLVSKAKLLSYDTNA